MKKIFILLINVFVITLTYSQITFQKTFSITEGRSVEPTYDGGYILAGNTRAFGAYHSVLIKYSCEGSIEWSRSYGEAAAFHHYGHCVIQTKDSGFVMTGAYRASGNVCITKTDKMGNIIWYKVFEAIEAWKVKQTLDGGYIIIANPGYFIKLDQSGNLQWAKKIGPTSGTISGEDIQQTLDGGYIGISSHFSPIYGEHAFVTKIDQNGTLQWGKYYTLDDEDKGYSILQLSSGEYILEGFSTSASGSNTKNFIIKTDISGNPIWAKAYPFANPSSGFPGFYNEIKLTNDGGFVFGHEYSIGAGYEQFLTKVDNAGAVLWSNAYAKGYLHSLAVTPDNGIVFTGWDATGMNLVKTNSLGISGCDEQPLSAQSLNIVVNVASPALISTTISTISSPAISSFPLIVTSNSLCSIGSCIVEPNLSSDIKVPNIFTPNDDGTNDIFTINCVNIQSLYGDIYNRWGTKIFEWNGVNGGWDGRTSAGLASSSGTYYYIITAKGKDGVNYKEKGFLQLLR
jgi:gliding motility-associated-like protein